MNTILKLLITILLIISEVVVVTLPIIVAVIQHKPIYLLIYLVWGFPMILLVTFLFVLWLEVINWLELKN